MGVNGQAVVIAAGAGAAREAIRQILQHAGLTLLDAVNADDALRLARERPMMVVLDAVPGAINGQEVFRRLRADGHTAAIPVLFLAAAPEPSLANVAEESQPLIRESEMLEQLSRLSNSMPVTAQAYGMKSIHEHSPEAFETLVQRYGELMDLALEQSSYIVDNNLTEELRTLGEKLGALAASPRDIIDLHTTALRRKREGKLLRRAQRYVEEGRFLVLELMGHVLSFYRRHATGTRSRPPRKEQPDA